MGSESSPPHAIADSLEEELLRLIARGARRSIVPVLCAACVVGWVLAARAPLRGVLAWFAVSCLFLVIRRLWVERLWPLRPGTDPQEGLRGVALFAFLTGGSFASATAFWPWLGDLERAVLTVVILGMCSGSVATNLGYRPTFVTFLMASAGPLALAWGWGAIGAEHMLLEFALVGLIVLFAFLLFMLARDSFGLFAAAFEARQAQRLLNRQLEAALVDADAASRAKTRFLASASHDLRQPLHTASLFSAALSMRPLDPKSRGIATNLNAALLSLGSQLDALLDISRLDAGVVEAECTDFALEPFVRGVEFDFRPQALSKRLRLTVRCDPAHCCRADPVLLGRIVRNLVDNAIKYTEVGAVEVRVDSPADDQGRLALSVCDSGVGIPVDEQSKVFEEFYQVGNSERDRTRGLGLGLSIVSRLARLQDVGLTMTSTPGQGTTVTLRLQRSSAPPRPVALPVASEAGMPALHVLVIDDEQTVRDGMTSLLESWGCTVDSVGDTESALASARRIRPDIVLADFRLRAPDDGILAVGAVREHCGGGSIPALLVSGDTAPARLQEAARARLRLLHKPVTGLQLQRAICEEIEREGSAVDARHDS